MTTAIVIGGDYPKYLGRIVDIVDEAPHEWADGSTSMLLRTDPILRSVAGVEIWWHPQHLSILPPAEQTQDDLHLEHQ